MLLLITNNRFYRNVKLKKYLQGYFRKFSNNLSVPEVDVLFSNGRPLKISTGEFARLADGCAVATLGDTSVMATVVSSEKPSSSSFLPLVVDYKQKFAGIGRIAMNTEKEILTSRVIDRSLRPLFPENFNSETQIVCDMKAVDSKNNPDVISINAASAALSLSNIPWNGPVGAVRLGFIDNEVVINPTFKELHSSNLNLVLTATKRNLVVMLEGEANNILQQDLLKAIKIGTKEAQHVIQSIEHLQKSFGIKKREVEPAVELSEEVLEALQSLSQMRIREVLKDYTHDKLSRDNALSAVRTDVIDKIKVNFPDLDLTLVHEGYNKVVKKIFRDLIFDEEKRCDGRLFDDLRPIECKVDLYKPLHGSAMFRRGQTQVFCTVNLGSPTSGINLDPITTLMSGVKKKNFYLKYEFPPYATKEIGRMGQINRREIGHGALAERGLTYSMPEDYPFTVRLLSQVYESNGSSSMASVCGGSLALMDAGVPLTAPAAGVAIGLVSRYDEENKNISDYRLLTDLLGIEDYMGDMDFKIAGTKKGITALQADIKIPGLPLKIVMEAIQKATDAKTQILQIMHDCLDKPRIEKKENCPVTEKLTIEVHKRGRLLGVGGTNLKKLYAETGVEVEQIDDTTFEIFAPNQSAMHEAQEKLNKLLSAEREPVLEFGGIYPANIVELRDIGVMVTLYPGMQPVLLHNSQLDQKKVMHPSALGLEVGQEIQVKYFGRDSVSGMMRLSRKVLQAMPK